MNMVEQVTDYVKNYDEEVGKAIEPKGWCCLPRAGK